MKFLSKILDSIDYSSEIIGKFSKYLILVIISIMLFEIISRYVFNDPTEWVAELSSYIFGSYFFLGGAYILLREGHVRMDILYVKWTEKGKKIADIATFPLFALYVGIVVYGGIGNIQFSLKVNEHSNSLWGPPLAPIKIIMTFGSLLLLIQGISIFIRDIFTIFNKKLPSTFKSRNKNNEDIKL